MAETYEDAIIIAAKKVGCTVEEYKAARAMGLKHCRICRVWLPLDDFGDDLSRWDLKASACRECKNQRARELYV